MSDKPQTIIDMERIARDYRRDTGQPIIVTRRMFDTLQRDGMDTSNIAVNEDMPTDSGKGVRP